AAQAMDTLAAKAYSPATKSRIEEIRTDLDAARSALSSAGANATDDALVKAASESSAPARRGFALLLAAAGDAWAAAEILGDQVRSGAGLSIPDLWAFGAPRGIEAGLARAEAALGEGKSAVAEAAVTEVVRRFRNAQAYDAARARIEGVLGRLVATSDDAPATVESLLHAAHKATKDGVLTVRYEFESSAEGADFRAAPGSAAHLELGSLAVTGRVVLLGSGAIPPSLFRSPISIRGRATIATADDPGFAIAWGGPAGETIARAGRPAGSTPELPRLSIISAALGDRRELATCPTPALVPFEPFDFEVRISGDSAIFTVAKVTVEAKAVPGGADGGIAVDTGGRTIFLDEIEISAAPNPRVRQAETSGKAAERLSALELDAPALPWVEW
ncbi:MAG: hypothetical protein JXP34_08635, partial [Planctomycetes bacterium]|nr:hypothetical protein [Planctomycetota bacterium]